MSFQFFKRSSSKLGSDSSIPEGTTTSSSQQQSPHSPASAAEKFFLSAFSPSSNSPDLPALALTDKKSKQSLKPKVSSKNNTTDQISVHSVATGASFATAAESFTTATTGEEEGARKHVGTIIDATSFEEKSETSDDVDSVYDDDDDLDDEQNSSDLAFGNNDPLTLIATSSCTPSTPSSSNTTTKRKIDFSEESSSAPEVTPITKDTMSDTVSNAPAPAVVETEAPVTEPATEEITPMPEEPPPAAPTTDDGPKFDVAQNLYEGAKGAWIFGKGVPLVKTFLGVTESAAATLLDKAIHTDLDTLDKQLAKPQLKKLDDVVVTPTIAEVWKIIGPAIEKVEEIVVRPVVEAVVMPIILKPLGLIKEKEETVCEEKEEVVETEDEKKSVEPVVEKDLELTPEVTTTAPVVA